MFLFTFLFLFLSSDKLKTKNSLRTNEVDKEAGSNQIAANTFLFLNLIAAVKNIRGDYHLGKKGFGRIYKGVIESIQVDFHELFLLFTFC